MTNGWRLCFTKHLYYNSSDMFKKLYICQRHPILSNISFWAELKHLQILILLILILKNTNFLSSLWACYLPFPGGFLYFKQSACQNLFSNSMSERRKTIIARPSLVFILLGFSTITVQITMNMIYIWISL